jgi:hypothetical protein
MIEAFILPDLLVIRSNVENPTKSRSTMSKRHSFGVHSKNEEGPTPLLGDNNKISRKYRRSWVYSVESKEAGGEGRSWISSASARRGLAGYGRITVSFNQSNQGRAGWRRCTKAT